MRPTVFFQLWLRLQNRAELLNPDSLTQLGTNFEGWALLRIITRAGAKSWPKLFQNMRASRETELSETHPIHVVCAWIGDSAAIAAKYYLQVRDSDFDRAAARYRILSDRIARNKKSPK